VSGNGRALPFDLLRDLQELAYDLPRVIASPFFASRFQPLLEKLLIPLIEKRLRTDLLRPGRRQGSASDPCNGKS
jgi:hypothetical protein